MRRNFFPKKPFACARRYLEYTWSKDHLLKSQRGPSNITTFVVQLCANLCVKVTNNAAHLNITGGPWKLLLLPSSQLEDLDNRCDPCPLRRYDSSRSLNRATTASMVEVRTQVVSSCRWTAAGTTQKMGKQQGRSLLGPCGGAYTYMREGGRECVFSALNRSNSRVCPPRLLKSLIGPLAGCSRCVQQQACADQEK